MSIRFYDEGRESYIKGFRARHNPYSRGSHAHKLWLGGNAQEHLDEEFVLRIGKLVKS